MAHDFSIRVKGSTEREKVAYFFGYANGMMYEAFGHPECNMMLSGSGEEIDIDRKTAEKGLKAAISMLSQIDYPDTKRIDDLKAFLKRIENGDISEEQFTIAYRYSILTFSCEHEKAHTPAHPAGRVRPTVARLRMNCNF